MGTLQTLVHELALALRGLQPALASPAAFQGLALRLGWHVDQLPAPILALGGEAAQIESALAPFFGGGDVSEAEVTALLDALRGLFDAIQALSTATFDPALAAESFGSEFPVRLVELIVGDYLVVYHPTIAFVAKAFGVLRDVYVPATSTRPAYLRHEVGWPDLGKIISDPSLLLRNIYGWGTPTFAAHELLGALAGLLASIKLQAMLEEYPEAKAMKIEQAGELPQTRWSLDTPLFFEDDTFNSGVRILPLPGTGAHLPGLAVMPYAVGAFEEGFALDDHLSFTIRSALDLQGGVAIRIRPNEPIDVVTGFDAGSPSAVTGMVSGRIEYHDPSLQPWTLLGTSTGTRIELVSIAGVGALKIDGTTPDLGLEIELSGGKVVIAAGEGDSFLQSILPANGITAPFDLAIGLSTTRGLYFRGSSALKVTLPIHADLGPLSINSITLGIGISDAGIPITAAADLGVQLGPIAAVVQGLGVGATLSFPGHNGNLGPLDFDASFKLPDGIGLQIGGGGFTGGGFIAHDAANGRYTGIVDVALRGTIALTGIGILDTRLPDGRTGYSLFISIGAQFRAIQLGLGFTLNGAGGMIGVHRTVRIDVIRAGLKDGTLSHILFPTNPVANAAAVISDLERVFPPEHGRFVLGPMMKIGWGTPTLITADLGLIVEVPDPIRIALVGVVRCFLPNADAPILKLQANFLGTVDLDRGRLSFDASLFDSRLLSFTLEGDMSARLSLLPFPNYLLSVGGFHPAYTPPPLDIPAMRRLTINLLGGSNPRLRAEVYFARTSNSFQFGASVELYASVSKFNIYGFLGFDTLIQVLPTHLAADVKVSLAVRIGDDPIMSSGVDFSIEGPSPWHAKGEAHFSICWFLSFDVHFDKTWGDPITDALAGIALLPIVIAALADDNNWLTRVPDHVHALARLRTSTGVVVDPAGTLVVSQKLVPLGLAIDRYSSATPTDANKFEITNITSVHDSFEHDPELDEFAPAEFFSMTDAEKLSRPSFERYPSGAVIGGAATLVADDVVHRDVSYEQIIVDRVSPGRRVGVLGLGETRFGELLRGGAVSRSVLAKNLVFMPVTANLTAVEEHYAVVSISDLRAHSSRTGTYAETLQELHALIAASPSLEDELQIVTLSEVA